MQKKKLKQLKKALNEISEIVKIRSNLTDVINGLKLRLLKMILW